jgi:hypothetical protein
MAFALRELLLNAVDHGTRFDPTKWSLIRTRAGEWHPAESKTRERDFRLPNSTTLQCRIRRVIL